ncbi:NAD(P)-binding protein [Coniophora puteana RWD-64-598 SS2]|uniref:NAD(P)-binding protein n=1 Tax=Coniophora puteana (strain RWD-64-598) TaxID=741705 RepID=A0A5M3MR96_CONPW|nr:NAD(P)-binding protein [Coniophora puteana RWD-64-598 SS2]EIW81596.1 NAD(P)-binding protein [Coniophora puteana RWD-64-598 SS2]
MPTWFLTGASRGIGLESTRQLLQNPDNTVFASCRSPSTASELQALADTAQGTLYIVEIDAASQESIQRGTAEVLELLDGRGLDYTFNNAAMNVGGDVAFDFDPQDLRTTMELNVIGPALISRYLLPAIEKSDRRVIMNMTTGLASIASDHGPKCASYSISKAAVNMLTYKQSRERPDIIAFVVDPGWVKTTMGGEGAMLEVEDAVASVLSVIQNARPEHSGKFLNRLGSEIPW